MGEKWKIKKLFTIKYFFLKIQKTCECEPESQIELSKKINRKNTMKFDIILPFWKAFLIFRFELLVLCSCAFPQNETTIARVNSTQLYYIQKAFCTHLVPGTTSRFHEFWKIEIREIKIIFTKNFFPWNWFHEFFTLEIILGESPSRRKIRLLFVHL